LIVFLINIHFISNFFEYYKAKRWFLSFKKITGKSPTNKDIKHDDLDKIKKFEGVLPLTYFWWILGILTPTWKVFLTLLTFNLILNFICQKIGEFTLSVKIIKLFNLILNTFILLILVLNHFHLHLDLFQVAYTFISSNI
jgi:hypothetical protein